MPQRLAPFVSTVTLTDLYYLFRQSTSRHFFAYVQVLVPAIGIEDTAVL